LKIPIILLLRTGPLGHFVLDTEMMIYLANEKRYPQKVYYIASSRVGNETLFAELAKKINILRFRRFFFFIRRLLIKACSNYSQQIAILENYDLSLLPKIHAEKSIFEPEDDFLEEELHYLRENFAITDASKVVCLAIRDSGHDLTMGMPLSEMPSFRNTPVDFFKSTVEELNLQGFKVFRLGRHNVEKLKLSRDSQYWDLTELSYVNKDKLELAIALRSQFMLSTGTGIEQIAAIFRKPILLINLAMTAMVPTQVYKRVLVSDHLKMKEEVCLKVPFEELVLNGYFSSNEFVKKIREGKLRINPKNSEEIKNFVLASIDFKDYGASETLSVNSDLISLFKRGFFVY
jgi:putative glycosyltransferase (TIGR04372 family)